MIIPENSLAQRSTDYVSKAKALVAEMTLEEKALLISGDGWWKTHAIDRLQIPSVCMTDGPHGLRKGRGRGSFDQRAGHVFSDRFGLGFFLGHGPDPASGGRTGGRIPGE